MVRIEQIKPEDRSQVRRFLRIPFSLYAGHSLWVPPILIDAKTQLNVEKHPFYEHSEAAFFVAVQGEEDLGRIAVLENNPYNQYHDKRSAQFYLFETVEDLEVARELFGAAIEWARARELNQLFGPKGFGPLDGMGMLVEGFEHRPAMMMMNYNPPFYPAFLEDLGFRKEVDFVSCYLGHDRFKLPERVHRIAERVAERGGFRVMTFPSRRELRKWAPEIGRAYNQAFVDNWEYYPLTEREVKFVTDNALGFAAPSLIKVILKEEKVVGFLFCFPDISAALQRSKGRLFPFGLFDMLLESKRTKWAAINGAGILPGYQGLGGNALLYSELEKSIHAKGFLHADLTQVAESATQMRADLENVGGVPYKNHRVFTRGI
jgi:hypothetical protein